LWNNRKPSGRISDGVVAEDHELTALLVLHPLLFFDRDGSRDASAANPVVSKGGSDAQ
jgi:hypothetical protein